MTLMARVDHARSGLQAANDRLSAARGLGKPKHEAPKEPEEKGFFDNISLSDVVHTGLDIAGFIPGLGAVADLANAALYLAEGDKVNAAIAAASAVPGAGDAITAGKLAAKVAAAAGGASAAAAFGKRITNATELTLDSKFVPRHLEGTPQMEKVLRKEGAAHVFRDEDTMNRVSEAIKQNGEYRGLKRGFERYGMRFDEPIGERISSDGSRIPLDYGEMKVKGDKYHVIPRTGPSR